MAYTVQTTLFALLSLECTCYNDAATFRPSLPLFTAANYDSGFVPIRVEEESFLPPSSSRRRSDDYDPFSKLANPLEFQDTQVVLEKLQNPLQYVKEGGPQSIIVPEYVKQVREKYLLVGEEDQENNSKKIVFPEIETNNKGVVSDVFSELEPNNKRGVSDVQLETNNERVASDRVRFVGRKAKHLGAKKSMDDKASGDIIINGSSDRSDDKKRHFVHVLPKPLHYVSSQQGGEEFNIEQQKVKIPEQNTHTQEKPLVLVRKIKKTEEDNKSDLLSRKIQHLRVFLNHEQDLETAVVVGTLPKLLPHIVDLKVLENQPGIAALGSGQKMHQQQLFVFHTTLAQLHKLLEEKMAQEVPTDLRPILKRTLKHNKDMIMFLFRYVMQAEKSPDKLVAMRNQQDAKTFSKHLKFLKAIFPFL